MAFRAARKKARRGLTETANYIGVTKQAVCAWERGASSPNVETLKRLANFYECTVDELVADAETNAEAKTPGA